MIKSISKQKIPKQYGYVLMTEHLNTVLNENGIDIHIDLDYRFFNQQIGKTIFEVHFWSPRTNTPYNRLYIRAGALQKEYVNFARKKLQEVVFPEFVKWIKAILDLPVNSPLY